MMEVETTILMSDKLSAKQKTVGGDKDRHYYITIKRSVQHQMKTPQGYTRNFQTGRRYLHNAHLTSG